jgi:MerR family transcriptional regulator, redox-sensitive transcriptional activator SoxR
MLILQVYLRSRGVMETMGIGELASKTGLRPSAIRYYESLGLVTANRRGNWRRYTPDAVEHLEVIRMARELGFGIDEIRTLLNGFSPETPPPDRWRQLAHEKLPQLDALIRHASAMKRLLEVGLTCRCVRIEDCFIEDCANINTSAGSGLTLVPLRAQPASVRRARPVTTGQS